MSITHVSDNFQWSEVSSHDGADCPLEYQPNARRLALAVLEPLRARFGGALIPVSWYRTPWHNLSVGGAKQSQHLTASAADVRPAEIGALLRLRICLEEMIHDMILPELGGWGWYPGRWIHVDVGPRRPDGKPRHWIGNAVGGEEPR